LLNEFLFFMKIYLDNCALQRPLDDKLQIRIRLEAEAILAIVEQCQSGEIELVSSEVLDLELSETPIKTRVDYGLSVLKSATIYVKINELIGSRAGAFILLGIKPLDALHLASAELAQADYFCTCDDRFLRRAKAIVDLKTKVVTPLELIEELSD